MNPSPCTGVLLGLLCHDTTSASAQFFLVSLSGMSITVGSDHLEIGMLSAKVASFDHCIGQLWHPSKRDRHILRVQREAEVFIFPLAWGISLHPSKLVKVIQQSTPIEIFHLLFFFFFFSRQRKSKDLLSEVRERKSRNQSKEFHWLQDAGVYVSIGL